MQAGRQSDRSYARCSARWRRQTVRRTRSPGRSPSTRTALHATHHTARSHATRHYKRIRPIMLAGAKPPISSQERGRSPTPKMGVGFLKRGQRAPLHQLRCPGERCKLPSGFRGEAGPLEGFLAFERRHVASPGTCWGPSSSGEGKWAPAPLKSAFAMHWTYVNQSKSNQT